MTEDKGRGLAEANRGSVGYKESQDHPRSCRRRSGKDLRPGVVLVKIDDGAALGDDQTTRTWAF